MCGGGRGQRKQITSELVISQELDPQTNKSVSFLSKGATVLVNAVGVSHRVELSQAMHDIKGTRGGPFSLHGQGGTAEWPAFL